MDRSISSSLFAIIIGFLLFFSLNTAFAKSGCCSQHGGVVGCNNATGYQLCKDGTTSPTCLCTGGVTKKPKTVTKSTTLKSTTVTPTATTTTTPVKTTSTKTVKATKTVTTGCCSGHGGVSKCDKKSGYLMCKDGTISPTCTCKPTTKKK